MLAWLATLFFAIATLVSGGDLHPGTSWLSPQTMIAAGLLCLALSLAGVSPRWPRRD